jgi:hypothetical protein
LDKLAAKALVRELRSKATPPGAKKKPRAKDDDLRG